jgi:hypothetical protein
LSVYDSPGARLCNLLKGTHLRTRLTLFALTLLAFGALSFAGRATTASADERDFILVNGSPNIIIVEVNVTSSGSREWGPDILGLDVLYPGESGPVLFDRYVGGSCFYDIQVFGDGGEEGHLYGINLCLYDTVTFQ